MSDSDSSHNQARICAKQTFELLPVLRRFVTARVQLAGADLGLSLRQFAALRGIREGASSPGELARLWEVTPAVITGIVDRLERRGLVRREPHPADRRRLRLILTDAGIQASEEVEGALTGDLAGRLMSASRDELAELGRALDLLQRTFAALEDRLPDREPCGPEDDMPPGRRGAGGGGRKPDARRQDGKDEQRPATNRGSGDLMEERTMATTSTETEAIPGDGAQGSAGTGESATELVEINVTDPHFMATAYDTYAGLREEGPVARVRFSTGRDTEETGTPRDRFFNSAAYFVTDYEAVVATLLDERFAVDPGTLMTPEEREQAPESPEEFRPLTRSLLNIDPPDHTRIRKLVQPSFTGRGMEAMRPGIQQVVDTLLDRAEQEAAARGETAPNRRMELIEALAYPFPVAVIGDMLGIPREDRQQIRGWTQNLLRVDRAGDAAAEEEVRAGLREFTAYLTDLFARKRREPTDDMISRMVAIEEDDDVLSEEEMLATVFLMYLAGHVTTVNLVGNGVVALLSHPEQLAKMQADPSLARNMVEETLRYWGPVDFIARRLATEDLEIAGTPIARGGHVAAGLASANHDPERFAAPEVFDIGREEANRHVAFGRGIHVCLGAPLARVEGQVAFETLIRRYPDLRLAVPADEIAWGGSFLRGFRQIPLVF